MKILTEKQPNRTDSFFYRNPIAEATAKDGTVFTSYPVGDVRLYVGDVYYINERRFDEDGFEQLTDKKIWNEQNVWENNNWFAIVADKDGEAYWDLEMVDHEYDSAIGALKDIVKQYDKGELKLN